MKDVDKIKGLTDDLTLASCISLTEALAYMSSIA